MRRLSATRKTRIPRGAACRGSHPTRSVKSGAPPTAQAKRLRHARLSNPAMPRVRTSAPFRRAAAGQGIPARSSEAATAPERFRCRWRGRSLGWPAAWRLSRMPRVRAPKMQGRHRRKTTRGGGLRRNRTSRRGRAHRWPMQPKQSKVRPAANRRSAGWSRRRNGMCRRGGADRARA